MKQCKCGCGREVKGDSDFSRGHAYKRDYPVNPNTKCECGCGGDISQKFNRLLGSPVRFLRGHSPRPRGENARTWQGGRRIKNGYVLLFLPDHSHSDPKGYIHEHVLVAEKALGRKLVGEELVHHHDRNRSNNANNNLVICPDDSYHMMIHGRMTARDACGNPNWKNCCLCKSYDDPANMVPRSSVNGPRVQYKHRKCEAEYRKKRYWSTEK